MLTKPRELYRNLYWDSYSFAALFARSPLLTSTLARKIIIINYFDISNLQIILMYKEEMENFVENANNNAFFGLDYCSARLTNNFNMLYLKYFKCVKK